MKLIQILFLYAFNLYAITNDNGPHNLNLFILKEWFGSTFYKVISLSDLEDEYSFYLYPNECVLEYGLKSQILPTKISAAYWQALINLMKQKIGIQKTENIENFINKQEKIQGEIFFEADAVSYLETEKKLEHWKSVSFADW